MGKKIAVIGAGAVGSYIGAHLTKSGQDLTFIDMWSEHVSYMKNHGLKVSGFPDEFTTPVKALHINEALSLIHI